MAKRIKRKHRETDDVPGLAGWLFTDLLLGISLIFLATTAFVITKPSTPVEGTATQATQVTLPCVDTAAFLKDPLVLQYKKGGGDSVGNDIKSFIKDQPPDKRDLRVAVALIYGDFASEDSSIKGVQVAKEFYPRFNRSDPDNFPLTAFEESRGNVRFFGTLGRAVNQNGVYMELFFVYNQCEQ